MQWNKSAHAGFTDGTPWIEVGATYESVNATTALADENSVFYHYKKLIQLRKEYDIISEGQIEMMLEEHPQVLAYKRQLKNQTLIVLNNYYKQETTVELSSGLVKDSKILISNYSDSAALAEKINLRPYESVSYLIEN